MSVGHASLSPTKQLCGAGFPGSSQHAALCTRIRTLASLFQCWHQDTPPPGHSSYQGQNVAWWPPQGGLRGLSGFRHRGGTAAGGHQWKESRRKITLGPDFKPSGGAKGRGLAPLTWEGKLKPAQRTPWKRVVSLLKVRPPCSGLPTYLASDSPLSILSSVSEQPATLFFFNHCLFLIKMEGLRGEKLFSFSVVFPLPDMCSIEYMLSSNHQYAK